MRETEIYLGRRETASLICSLEQVQAFAELTGDRNPLYLDKEFASTTLFERPIVQGPLYTGLLNSIIGTSLPGPGTVLVYQEHNFYKPLFVGDEVTAVVTVTAHNAQQGIIHLGLSCLDSSGEEIMNGRAVTFLARAKR